MARRKQVEITEDQYLRCIAAREAGETKKRQCEILGINYNTTRLDNLIDEYYEAKEHRKRMMKEMRKKPVTNDQVCDWALMYLQGIPLGTIAEQYYRTPALVKARLIKLGVMGLMCHEKVDPLNPPLVPDELMECDFEVGQIVFVPAYKCVGTVMHCYGESKEGVNQYRIYLAGDRERNIAVNAYDIGSLEGLREIGVAVDKLLQDAYLDGADVKMLLSKALTKANMRAKEEKKR
ncbi:D2 protein [Vibrio phage VCPH]|nr:D2 protein [Vibrio phage VCPH]